MRILYVEDNEVNRALVERVVRARKFSVVFHDEGEEALKTLENDAAIDVILLDIELAGTISGLDVIRTLRARNDKRPVVAVTAYAMMGDRERILEAGCDQYLPKPLVITELLAVLDHYSAELAAKAAEPVAVAQPVAVAESVAASAPVAVAEPAAGTATPPPPVVQPAPAASETPAPAVVPPPGPAAGETTTPAAEATPAVAVSPVPVAPAAAPVQEVTAIASPVTAAPAAEAPLSGQESIS
jgi:CheY-like chemotaxis protein